MPMRAISPTGKPAGARAISLRAPRSAPSAARAPRSVPERPTTNGAAPISTPMTTACTNTNRTKAAAIEAPSGEQVTDEQVTDEQVIEQVDEQVDETVTEPVPEPVEKPVKKAAAKGKGKPKPGTQAWNNSCDKRFRSFNPKTGLYKSLSGKWRKCQL